MPEDRVFDERQFLRVFVKHEGSIRAYGRSLLPNWDAVEEAMQEASVIMWRKIGQLQSEDDFLPWAKVILRYEALKLRRKYARDRHVFSDNLIEMLAKEGLEQIESFEHRQKAMEECLQGLSMPHRELVLAPYVADNAVTEIAERSGRTVNSLYKLLGRLRLKLRRCVEERLGLSAMEGITT